MYVSLPIAAWPCDNASAAVKGMQAPSPSADAKSNTTATLEALLQTAGPYWVCVKKGSGSSSSVWLFNVPLLVQNTPELEESAEAFVSHASPTSRPISGTATPDAKSNGSKQSSAETVAAATAQLQLAARVMGGMPAAPAAPPAAEAASRTGDSKAAAGGKGAAAFAAGAASSGACAAAAAAAAAGSRGGVAAGAGSAAGARLAALFGPHDAKRGPAVALDFTQQLPGLGPVQVGAHQCRCALRLLATHCKPVWHASGSGPVAAVGQWLAGCKCMSVIWRK